MGGDGNAVGPGDLPGHVRENREYWDGMAEKWVAPGERAWAAPTPYWGIWSIPEPQIGMLPQDMRGQEAIELGCGTAYVSAWMARRGARVVGIDNSERQLDTARKLAARYGLDITLIHGNAETVPLPDATFDFAVSEYGAAIWCDPYRWVPEAHRLLRAGGRLVFLGHTPLSQICSPLSGAPCEPRLHRDYFGLHRVDWSTVEIEPGGVEFNLTISAWLRLFRETGFLVEDFLEPQAPEIAPWPSHFVPHEWARRWPAEQVWKLRKAG